MAGIVEAEGVVLMEHVGHASGELTEIFLFRSGPSHFSEGGHTGEFVVEYVVHGGDVFGPEVALGTEHA